jgi:hypothetical protein
MTYDVRNPGLGATRRRHISAHPPIHRMNDDAQPLTPTELMAHRQLLSQHQS